MTQQETLLAVPGALYEANSRKGKANLDHAPQAAHTMSAGSSLTQNKPRAVSVVTPISNTYAKLLKVKCSK